MGTKGGHKEHKKTSKNEEAEAPEMRKSAVKEGVGTSTDGSDSG